MKIIKRWTALLFACLLAFGSGYTDTLAAAADGTDAAIVEEEKAPKETALVNHVYVHKPMVEAPGAQSVLIGIGDANTVVESAELSYRDEKTGQAYQAQAAQIIEGFVLFEMDYQDQNAQSTYRLESITYTADGETEEASFAEMGIDASYGVNQVAKTEPDDVLLTDEEVAALSAETQMEIVSMDKSGTPISSGELSQALEDAGCEAETAGAMDMRRGASVDATGMKSLVVVLDAGHGGSDPGAVANGIVEKTVNLKIAQYCKAELEEYSGIIVHMTRNDDTYLSLAARAQVAIDKKADVFVSLHNNSNASSVPYGSNVYYPNSNYNANCGATGQALAQVILTKLTELGLANGGIHIRNSENGTKYPDGSLADYYGVIKRCKENGIPGLIVEHAFLSNASDAKNYLSTDAQLKKLGIADATGIAEYFGLKKGLGFNSIQSKSGTTMDLSWTPVVGVSGYCIYRSLTSGDGFEEVAKVNSASTTTWRDSGLTPGTTYYYKIRTFTKSGSSVKYSKYSAVVSGTTLQNPMITSVKSKNSKQLEISWATVNDASNYELYRAAKKKGTYEKIATLTGINRVSYLDKNVKPGKMYYYKIRSIGQVDNATVYSEYSPIASGRTAQIPTEVAVKSQATDTLRVSWEADENAAGYIIKRADSAKGKFVKVGTVNGGDTDYFDDIGVKANKYYYYKVQAFNYNNKVKGVSGFGKTVSAKTIKKMAITEIVTNSSTSQTIKWKKMDGVDGYLVYQSTAKNGKYKKLAKVSPAKTSYKATKLKPGVRYYYKVRARKKVNDEVGYGSYSTIRTSWIPKAPEITAVLPQSANSVQIFWNPINGARRYTIYCADMQGGDYQQIAEAEGDSVSFIDTGLRMGGRYYYKIEAAVKCYKGDVQSGMSNEMGGSPVNATRITSVTAQPQGGLTVAWEPVADASGYQVYRSAAVNGMYAPLTMIMGAAVNYIDHTAEKGVTYYYKVAPVCMYNGSYLNGEMSPAVSGAIPAEPQGKGAL